MPLNLNLFLQVGVTPSEAGEQAGTYLCAVRDGHHTDLRFLYWTGTIWKRADGADLTTTPQVFAYIRKDVIPMRELYETCQKTIANAKRETVGDMPPQLIRDVMAIINRPMEGRYAKTEEVRYEDFLVQVEPGDVDIVKIFWEPTGGATWRYKQEMSVGEFGACVHHWIEAMKNGA